MTKVHSETRVLVTGGAQGLGLAVAERLVQDGCRHLVIVGRNATKGERAVKHLRKMGCKKVYFHSVELGEPNAGKEIVDFAVEQLGHLNAIANCAADTARAEVGEVTAEGFDRQMAVNARTPMLAAQALAAHCKEKNIRGSIVNVGSINWYCGRTDLAPYSASKSALVCITRNLANAYRPTLRINCVNIGWMDTPTENKIQIEYNGLSENWLEEAEKEQPFGSLIKPFQVAHQISLFLAPISGVVTGTIMEWDQNVLAGKWQ